MMDSANWHFVRRSERIFEVVVDDVTHAVELDDIIRQVRPSRRRRPRDVWLPPGGLARIVFARIARVEVPPNQRRATAVLESLFDGQPPTSQDGLQQLLRVLCRLRAAAPRYITPRVQLALLNHLAAPHQLDLDSLVEAYAFSVSPAHTPQPFNAERRAGFTDSTDQKGDLDDDTR